MLAGHVPVLDHFAELGGAVGDKLLFYTLRIADNTPEIFTYIDFELVILGKLSKFGEHLELLEAELLKGNELNLVEKEVNVILLEVERTIG